MVDDVMVDEDTRKVKYAPRIHPQSLKDPNAYDRGDNF
jgi:hypothetical protein